mmetsp:Transcript_15997/g.44262  ORF Transcript_15997/g.44262 Transcript_15997/m.44262 type:complete len:186 (+) Transcript_15997:1547-2104(+)
MHSNSQGQITSVVPKLLGQIVNKLRDLVQTVPSKPRHPDSVILLWFWKACGGHITISDSLQINRARRHREEEKREGIHHSQRTRTREIEMMLSLEMENEFVMSSKSEESQIQKGCQPLITWTGLTSTLKTPHFNAIESKALNMVSRSWKTCSGSRLELHLVKPARSAKKTVVSGNFSAIGGPPII